MALVEFIPDDNPARRDVLIAGATAGSAANMLQKSAAEPTGEQQ